MLTTSRRSRAIRRRSRDLGGESHAPKGRKDSARDFNPGLRIAERCALKVAPEVRRLSENPYPPQIALAARNSCAAFRAPALEMANPGLKPRAESFRPFGAINVSS